MSTETKKSKANVRKIKRELKWKPQVSFKEGIKKIIEFMDGYKE